ncbi:MAG: response regulator transcription factor [Verrucomicrobiaceae bacterium]|nr:response regulator transcription factor [Verrucomicrobiaceae bacterium]
MRILVIEDEKELARHICSALNRVGHTTEARHDGLKGLEAAVNDPPDLIVLDLNLPTLDGFGVLRSLKESHSPSRVIILTARAEIESRVKGLNAGADDYLPKPFSMDELAARIDALGRRSAVSANADMLKVGNLTMDVRHRRVWRGGVQIALSPREFELLQLLMQEPGRVFSRTELCERIWERDHAYDTRTVEIFITRLRKKLDVGHDEPLIHTIRSMGYCIKSEQSR